MPSKRRGRPIAASLAPWAPAVLVALLVVIAPWVVLAPLVIPARPGRLDLPVVMGGLIVAVPWVLIVLFARRVLRARKRR
jgi:hypothetical protein